MSHCRICYIRNPFSWRIFKSKSKFDEETVRNKKINWKCIKWYLFCCLWVFWLFAVDKHFSTPQIGAKMERDLILLQLGILMAMCQWLYKLMTSTVENRGRYLRLWKKSVLNMKIFRILQCYWKDTFEVIRNEQKL